MNRVFKSSRKIFLFIPNPFIKGQDMFRIRAAFSYIHLRAMASVRINSRVSLMICLRGNPCVPQPLAKIIWSCNPRLPASINSSYPLPGLRRCLGRTQDRSIYTFLWRRATAINSGIHGHPPSPATMISSGKSQAISSRYAGRHKSSGRSV